MQLSLGRSLCLSFFGTLTSTHLHTAPMLTHTCAQQKRRCRCYVFVFAKIKQYTYVHLFLFTFLLKNTSELHKTRVLDFFKANILHTLHYLSGGPPLAVGWLNPLTLTHTLGSTGLDGAQYVPETNASNGRLKSKWQNWTTARIGCRMRECQERSNCQAGETRFEGNLKRFIKLPFLYFLPCAF